MDFDSELQQTVNELAGGHGKTARKIVDTSNEVSAILTPRADVDPQRYDFARLGETVADSLIQTAQEQANRANVMLEQAQQLADDIRSRVAEKNRELTEMNRQLTAFGEKVLAAARES